MKKIIAIGTGRCGSQSLAQFLDSQLGYTFTHCGGGLRWYPISRSFDGARLHLDSVNGDYNPAWVNYIDRLLPNPLKVIWLVREDLDEVAKSYWSYKSLYPAVGLPMEPQFEQTPVQERDISYEAIRRAVDRVWYLCELVAKSFQTLVVPMEGLSERDTMVRILDWVGVPQKSRKLEMPHINTREQMIAATAESIEKVS